MRTLLTLFLLFNAAGAAPGNPTQSKLPAPQSTRSIPVPQSATSVSAPAPDDPETTPPKFVELAAPRFIPYSPQEIVTINAHVRFMTVLVLPMGEKVIDSFCGDSDFWKVEVVENLVYIKPTKSWIATNLTLLGKSGTLYTFYLKEVDDIPNLKPDIKVSITFNDNQKFQAAPAAPRFVTKAEFDNVVQDYQQELNNKENKVREVKQAADNALTQMRLDYPAQLHFDYDVALKTAPFYVTAMYADNRFTYIRLEASEIPAVYEIRDGKPSLVNYDFVNGTYIVRKIVDQGYLAIGKAKLHFSRRSK